MTDLLSGLSRYRHISFDLWLTLIRSNPQFKPNRDLLFKNYFKIEKPLDEVASVIRKFDILTNTINEKVCRNFNTSEIYYLILDALDVDVNTVEVNEMEEFYLLTEELLMQYKPLLLNQDIPVLLKHLHGEGKSMNILSNTAFIKGSSLRKILEYYGLTEYFTFQAYSDETGYSKPAREMFQYAYDLIQKTGPVAMHEVLHVGDNKVSDYYGATKFGFQSLLITPDIYEFKLQPA